MDFRKVQLEMLHREGECNNNEGDADSDREEGLSFDVQSKPQVKKVLRLLTPVSTYLNSVHYFLERALVQRTR